MDNLNHKTIKLIEEVKNLQTVNKILKEDMGKLEAGHIQNKKLPIMFPQRNFRKKLLHLFRNRTIEEWRSFWQS